MNNDGPTFLLPACPVCSQPPRREHLFAGSAERPEWHFASRTSDKRKVRCYLWGGCAHAEAVANEATKSPVGPGGFEAVERAWSEACAKLLVERTARWTDAARSELARFLADRPYGFDTPEHNAPATHEQRPTNQP